MTNVQVESDSEEEDEPVTDDSGVSDIFTRLSSPAEDGSLDFITKILNWSEDRTNQVEGIDNIRTYALVMVKTFDCPHQGCIEHPTWSITVKRVEGLEKFEDLPDDNDMLCKLEKWVMKLTESILPQFSEINFISTIFGRR